MLQNTNCALTNHNRGCTPWTGHVNDTTAVFVKFYCYWHVAHDVQVQIIFKHKTTIILLPKCHVLPRLLNEASVSHFQLFWAGEEEQCIKPIEVEGMI